MSIKLFISWSKDDSKSIALALHEWIPKITMNSVKTWCSADPRCLPHGNGFPEKILENARSSQACLVVLTKANLVGWWVNFESGLFLGQKKNVYAILCGDLTHQWLASQGHPLSVSGVNYTSMTVSDLSSFFISLNPNNARWLKMDFENQVRKNFDELKKIYDNIFTENYIKMSNLLSDSCRDEG